jgi:hypothetical protein
LMKKSWKERKKEKKRWDLGKRKKWNGDGIKKVKEENHIVFHNTWHACAGFIKFSKVTWLPTTKAYIGSIWEGSWSLRSWVLWLHRLHLLQAKLHSTFLHAYMLQYGAAPLLKCLVGPQQEPLKKPELERCQIGS